MVANLGITSSHLLDKLEKAIDSKEIAAFIGAGVSMGAGFVSWKELLRKPADEISLDIDKEENDLISLAQFYCNVRKRGAIDALISGIFSEKRTCTEDHKILAELPIDNYWTTNYDNLIERSLEEAQRNPSVRTEDKNLKLPIGHYDSFVYKMHGDYTQPQNAVITRDDYEEYGIHTRKLFRDVLEGHLLTKTFLFLGFSFTDPNFKFVISKIKVLLKGNTRNHYCIMRKPSKPDNEEEMREYKYHELKLKYEIEDLSRYGIEVCLVNSYEEQTEILNTLLIRHRRKTVFISGSADNYEPMQSDKAIELIHGLAYRLVANGYHIVSGFGKGIGSYLLNGVAEYCYGVKAGKVSDCLTLMPFPLSGSNEVHLREMWSKYRQEMIKRAGTAIFIFGNKKTKDDQLVLADGMDEEYEIALSNNAVPLPINLTGSKAEELYRKALSSIHPSERPALALCGKEYVSNESTIKDIVNAVDLLNRKEGRNG